jgi:hypothetical protein
MRRLQQRACFALVQGATFLLLLLLLLPPPPRMLQEACMNSSKKCEMAHAKPGHGAFC